MYENVTDWTSGTMPGYDSQECTAARTAFNAQLTGKGGAAFGSGNNSVNWWYLSSTESSVDRAASLYFEEGHYSNDQKGVDGNIRWIREF